MQIALSVVPIVPWMGTRQSWHKNVKSQRGCVHNFSFEVTKSPADMQGIRFWGCAENQKKVKRNYLKKGFSRISFAFSSFVIRKYNSNVCSLDQPPMSIISRMDAPDNRRRVAPVFLAVWE